MCEYVGGMFVIDYKLIPFLLIIYILALCVHIINNLFIIKIRKIML